MFRKCLISAGIIMGLISMAGCSNDVPAIERNGLKPGKYEVITAQYETDEQDYEFELKDLGEYDADSDRIEKIIKPELANMYIEVQSDGKHQLFIRSENDIQIETESSTKKKSNSKSKSSSKKSNSSSK